MCDCLPFLAKLVQPSLSDKFPNKTVRDGMFGLGMALKEILSCLFNPCILKILDLYLETWFGHYRYVWRKPFTGEWIYGIMQEHTLLTILFIFNTFVCCFFFHYYYHIAIFVGLHHYYHYFFIT